VSHSIHIEIIPSNTSIFLTTLTRFVGNGHAQHCWRYQQTDSDRWRVISVTFQLWANAFHRPSWHVKCQ